MSLPTCWDVLPSRQRVGARLGTEGGAVYQLGQGKGELEGAGQAGCRRRRSSGRVTLCDVIAATDCAMS